MLGHIIQVVSSMTFDSYITENIFKPLGMGRTTFSKEQYEKDSDRMTPYWKKPDGSLTPTAFPYPNVADNPDFSFVAAAGGVISSVRELTNWLTVNLEKGRFGDRRLLSPESVERIQTLHIGEPRGFFGREGYGYGWGITEDFFGYKMVSHGGSILVSTAHLAFVPELKIGVAMASNTAGYPYGAAAQGIFAALMGKDPRKVVPALLIQERMEHLTGTYETYRALSRVNVVNKGGLLYLEQRDEFAGSSVPLIPEDDRLETYRFYMWSQGVRQPIEFVVHSPNKVDLYVERSRYHKVAT